MNVLDEPIFVSVKETKRLLSLGHTRVYELMNSGDLERVKAGGKTLISYESIKNYAALLKIRQMTADNLADSQRLQHKLEACHLTRPPSPKISETTREILGQHQTEAIRTAMRADK